VQPSSILCRTQEAHQRALASAATLENVKLIANTVAVACAKEARAAEHREDRQSRNCALHESVEEYGEPPPFGDRTLSENPDRGHASVAGVEEATQ
jgi:hypothetical protein